MSYLDDKCPVSKQIENIDDAIKELNFRIHAMEGKLRALHPESADRKTIENELREIKKLVDKHEENLKELRKKNKRTFAVCAIIVFLIFLIYSIYVLIYGYE